MLDIRYLVFGGGGAAGYAYGGALTALAVEPGFSFDRIKAVSGTSVGAIAALMVSLNYGALEASEKLTTLDLKKLQDGGTFLGQSFRLLSKFGIYKGQALLAFILEILQEKTGRSDPENITFVDLKNLGYKDLYVVATKLYKANNKPTGKQKVFSIEKTPHTSVAFAILASAAAPVYFTRVRFKKIAKGTYIFDEKGDVYNDGGILNNFPITLFDAPKYLDLPDEPGKKIVNPYTLGFALRDTDQINNPQQKPQKTTIYDWHPLEYTQSIINSLLSQYEDENLDKAFNRQRTIQIDRLGVSLNEFDIDYDKKQALLASGRKAVKTYFENLPHLEKKSPIHKLSLWGEPVNQTTFNETLSPAANGELGLVKK